MGWKTLGSLGCDFRIGIRVLSKARLLICGELYISVPNIYPRLLARISTEALSPKGPKKPVEARVQGVLEP